MRRDSTSPVSPLSASESIFHTESTINLYTVPSTSQVDTKLSLTDRQVCNSSTLTGMCYADCLTIYLSLCLEEEDDS